MITIYLAAAYERRLELCNYRDELQRLGYRVQARWLDGPKQQLSHKGVELGVEEERKVEAGEADRETRCLLAMRDYEDIDAADIVVSFTEPPGSLRGRGGRHVEFGMALALQKLVMVVGHRENIFHCLSCVCFFDIWKQAISFFETLRLKISEREKEKEKAPQN